MAKRPGGWGKGTRKKPAKAYKKGDVKKAIAKHAKALKKQLKQPALPHTQGMRSSRLDQLCEDIGEGMALIASTQSDVADSRRAAQRVMATTTSKTAPDGISFYSAAGIDLVRVPGDEKLIVKRSKKNTTTTNAPKSEAQLIDESGGADADNPVDGTESDEAGE